MMNEFVIDGKGKKLSIAVRDKYNRIGYDTIRKLLRKGEIRVNGKKVFTDVFVNNGDVIRVYGVETDLSRQIVYDDDNIAVFYKPPKIASVGEGSFSEAVKSEYPSLFICHRLDTNTDGLIIFAKNEAVFEEIKRAFNQHNIEKKYLTVVAGTVTEGTTYRAYLKKDSEKNTVKIYKKKLSGSEEIVTKIEPVATENGLSLLDVTLITGKTHQIRAHLAYENMPIIGDPKYGNNELNHHYNKSYQMLHAYELIFHIGDGPLAYLNGKSIAIDTQKYRAEYDSLLSHK